jgi:hypothetical protein
LEVSVARSISLSIGLLLAACGPRQGSTGSLASALTGATGLPGAINVGPSDPNSRWASAQKAVEHGSFRVNAKAVHNRIGDGNIPPDLGLQLPHWTDHFKSGGVDFPYAVVGADPALGQTTVVETLVIPYRFIFPDGTVLDASTDLVDGVTSVSIRAPVAPTDSSTTNGRRT